MHCVSSLKFGATMSGAGAVQFSDDLPAKPEKKTQENERTKYLTMKYGQQQIRLIQKRLKVEFWMDEQLNKLYEITVSLLLFVIIMSVFCCGPGWVIQLSFIGMCMGYLLC